MNNIFVKKWREDKMLQTIKRLLSYIRFDLKRFIIGVLLLLVTTAAALYTPMIAKKLIDEVVTPASQTGQLHKGALFYYVGLYIFMNGMSFLCGYLGQFTLNKMANYLVKMIRDEVFSHVQKLPVKYFDNLPAGKIVSRITNDTEVVRSQFYNNTLAVILNSTVLVIGTYIAIYLLNPYLALGLLCLIPVIIIWQWGYAKLSSKYLKELRELVSVMNGKLNETIQGMEIIQTFQQEQRMDQEFAETSDAWVREGEKFIRLDSFAAWSFLALLRNVTMLSVVVFISVKFLNGTSILTAGMIYAFMDYVVRLFEPLNALVQILSSFQQSVAAGSRVFELMDEPALEEVEREFMMQEAKVVFKNVNFAYKDDIYVLHDINFVANPGETVAFVGHTGSGKSSILNLLFRFYDPNSGQIIIDHQDTKEYSRLSVRREMAIVLQDPFLFTGTLASNIRLNDESISDEEIVIALEKVGATHLLEKHELGINMPVTEKGKEFSSGERQLISFARALVYNPKLLILDEATSHVDSETEAIIQNAMAVVSKGRTTFIIAHRLSTIMHADQIIVLDKGRIIEQGTHQELLQKDGMYALMYQMQATSKTEN